MAIDPILLALTIHGRTYCGLSAEEALMIAEKVVELVRATPEVEDAADVVDLFDDVWAASLLAGVINEGDKTNPIHPLTPKEHLANFAESEEERLMILAMPDENFPANVDNPEHYTDPMFVAKKKRLAKKRRKWLRKRR